MTDTRSVATKAFDPVALAAFTTGILMTEFTKVHEAAEWLIGHPVWTHELPMLADRLKALTLAQFPEMPTKIETTWEAQRDAIRAQYGQVVDVTQGSDQRVGSPMTTAELVFAEEPTQ